MGQITTTLTWLFGNDVTSVGLLLAVLVLILGGFVKGTVGFAVGLITVAGLVQVFPPKVAVIALSIPFLLSNVVVLWADGFPREFLRDQVAFIATLMVGLLAGVLLLNIISEQLLFLFLAGYIGLFFLAQRFEERIYRLADTHLAGMVAGGIGGVLGGAVGVPGPPLIIHAYLNTLHEGKTAFVTATSSLFLIAHVVRLVFLSNVGLLGSREIVLGGVFSVPIYLGVVLGIRTRPYVEQRRFTLAVKGLLALIGLRLFGKALGWF